MNVSCSEIQCIEEVEWKCECERFYCRTHSRKHALKNQFHLIQQVSANIDPNFKSKAFTKISKEIMLIQGLINRILVDQQNLIKLVYEYFSEKTEELKSKKNKLISILQNLTFSKYLFKRDKQILDEDLEQNFLIPDFHLDISELLSKLDPYFNQARLLTDKEIIETQNNMLELCERLIVNGKLPRDNATKKCEVAVNPAYKNGSLKIWDLKSQSLEYELTNCTFVSNDLKTIHK